MHVPMSGGFTLTMIFAHSSLWRRRALLAVIAFAIAVEGGPGVVRKRGPSVGISRFGGLGSSTVLHAKLTKCNFRARDSFHCLEGCVTAFDLGASCCMGPLLVNKHCWFRAGSDGLWLLKLM